MDQTRAPCRSVSTVRLTVNKGCVPVPARSNSGCSALAESLAQGRYVEQRNAPRHWENVCPVMRVRVLEVGAWCGGGGETHTHTGRHWLRLPLQWDSGAGRASTGKEGFVPSFPGLRSSHSPHPPARQSKDNFIWSSVS